MPNRHLSGFGLNPIIGYLLLLSAFVGLSIYLFIKTEFAENFYTLVAIGFYIRIIIIFLYSFLHFIN